MERIEPSLATGINQASSHKHDDDSITAAIISAASDADRDDARDLCSHHHAKQSIMTNTRIDRDALRSTA